MSTKTAIDLSTLGAPDNDSEGVDCYISEKGVQASPESTGELVVADSANAGKYQSTMYMNGKSYYIFTKRIYDENMKNIRPRFYRFKGKDDGFVFEDVTNSQIGEVPDDFFTDKDNSAEKRPIKTISYMTLTNKTLQFFNLIQMNTIDFEVSNHIVALFNCNVVAFINEEDSYLTFVKNPIFATKTQDDITDHFPMGILSLRSWSPLWVAGSVMDSVNLKKTRDGVAILLSEESVFLYDKRDRKVLALRQLRRRCKSDPDDITYSNYISDNPISVDTTIENKFHTISTNTAEIPRSYFEYVNQLYLFTGKNFYTSFPEEYYEQKWSSRDDYNGQITTSAITQTPANSWYDNVRFFGKYPILQIYDAKSKTYHKIPFCFFNSLDSTKKEIDGLKVGFAKSNYGSLPVMAGLYVYSFFRAWATGGSEVFENGDTIDDVLSKIESRVSSSYLATPDNWTRITNNGEFEKHNDTNQVKTNFAMSGWSRVYEINGEAVLNGTSLSYHRQDYLWGQRSRAFSLGTKIYTDANPYTATNKNEEIEISKWREQERIGNDLRKLPISVDSLAPAELAGKTLKIRDYNENLIIPTLIEMETQDVTIEYQNAVYYTDIGSFNITPANNQFEVPSNISDKIIGLWGEDRDILFISSKSIERFNIADSIDVPLSFVRLEKTYDQLIDWSGINKRLDILTKEKGAICLNGEKRVNAIFNEDSRIAPDTVWKATDLRVIENTGCIYVIDSQNRAFKQDIEAPIFSLTKAGGTKPLLAGNFGIFYCEWESSKRFKVEWTYRNERNILLSEITIRMAQFDTAAAQKKRRIELYRITDDGTKRINSVETAQSTVKFYKIGRGLSCRFRIETEGYLKEVVLTDTEGWQK